ncbi:hypothetical protein CCP1ISM_2030001 [Azospirillaceae bacterium]
MNSRQDRLEHCIKELDDINIKFKRFPGLTFKEKANFPNIGSRGCFESHKSILEMNINNRNPILIMEDDILINRQFSIKHYLNDIPSNWDMLFFYNSNNDKSDKKWIKTRTLGTHFYIINNKSIQKILSQLYTKEYICNIDVTYTKINAEIFCTNNQLVIQDTLKFKSDILDLSKPNIKRFYKRLPIYT